MDFIFHILNIIGITVPLVLAYTFLFGRGKVFHFGPVGVALICVYSIFLTLGATGSFLLALGAGVVASILCSLLYAWLSFRLDADGFGILSIAMHLGILNIILNWQSLTNGAMGITNIPRISFMQTQGRFTFWLMAVCVAWIVFFLWLDRTSLARQLSALAENEWHAKSLGISRIRVHLIAFIILGLTMASDSFFYPQFLHLLYPTDYGFPIFMGLMMMVVAGKPGSIWGATISSVVLVILKECLRFVPLPNDILGPTRLLIFGVILLGAVWVQRESLFPKKRSI